MVEKILKWLDQCRGLRSVALRYFNACGPTPARAWAKSTIRRRI